MAAEASAAPPPAFTERLYDATSRALIDVFRDAEAEAKSLLVVGHNPGLQEAATALIATATSRTASACARSCRPAGWW